MTETFLVVGNAGSHEAELPVLFSAFPDGDTHCIIKDVERTIGKPVIVFHRLYPNQNSQLVKLLFVIDLLRDSGAGEISIFVPYLPYSRQDKRHITGEAISVETICRMIKAAGATSLYTLDCHFMKDATEVTCGGLRVKSTSVGPILVHEFQEKMGHNNFDVVGPDEGSGYLTENYGKKHMHKLRGDYGNIELENVHSYREIKELTDENITHEHDHVLIIDDMISTGSTIIKAISNLKAKGIKHISCATTHGFFLNNSYEILRGQLEELIFSDSIRSDNAAIDTQMLFWQQIVPEWDGSHVYKKAKSTLRGKHGISTRSH